MKVNLFASVDYVNEESLKGSSVVVIDVLRATSVITTAINNGCSEILPVLEIEEALSLKSEKSLLGGERKGLKIEGFDLSNSPLEYTKESVYGKTIVFTTTNGTRAILKSKYADRILVGSMLNAKKLAHKLIEYGDDVSILCAGTGGNFSMDDFICAGKIIYEMNKIKALEKDDFSSLAYISYVNYKDNIFEYLSHANHYNYLLSLGLKEDIEYCFQEDILESIPCFVDGKIVKL